MPKSYLTDEAVEAEIERLRNDPNVALAAAGITMDLLDDYHGEEDC